MSEENQQEAQREYTPEDLKKMDEMRANMTKFYKDEIKHIQPQATYYRLLAEIEESKVRRYAAMAQGAHMFAQAEAAEAQAKFDEEAAKKMAEEAATKVPNPSPMPTAEKHEVPTPESTTKSGAEKKSRKLAQK